MAIKLQGTNSAAAPGLTNDGNDGVAVGTDSIDLSIGGASKFKVGSAGQLGIGGANYGTTGQVLKSAGASAAPTWGTDTGGKVLGMATASVAETSRTTSSTSYIDSGLEVVYTPTASNSKALIFFESQALPASNGYTYIALRQADGIIGGGAADTEYVGKIVGNGYDWGDCSFTAYITPTWTAGTATSFQIYWKTDGTTGYLGWGDASSSGHYADYLTIQEIAA